MRILKVLRNKHLPAVPPLHTQRAAATMAAVDAILHSAFLTVTALSRRLRSPALTKHNTTSGLRTRGLTNRYPSRVLNLIEDVVRLAF